MRRNYPHAPREFSFSIGGRACGVGLLRGLLHEGVGVEWRVKVKVFCLWLEKNNEGWGSISMLTLFRWETSVTFISREFFLLLVCGRVDFDVSYRHLSLFDGVVKVSFTS